MRLDVILSPAEPWSAGAAGTAVVIDVLRASSTILEALVNGARGVIPVAGVDQAVRIADEIGRETALLCGERGGAAIAGFELGNSPPEFTPARVKGRTLVMSTTNGTAALIAARGAQRCIVAALRNAHAVAAALAAADADAVLVCAGREGRFALEDALCAGIVARGVVDAGKVVELGDGARAALRLAGRQGRRLDRVLARTEAGRQLRSIGKGRDVTFCARLDVHDRVPVVREGRVQLQDP